MAIADLPEDNRPGDVLRENKHPQHSKDKDADSGYNSSLDDEDNDLYGETANRVEVQPLTCCTGDGSCVKQDLDLIEGTCIETIFTPQQYNSAIEKITQFKTVRGKKVYTHSFKEMYMHVSASLQSFKSKPDKSSLLHVAVSEERIEALLVVYFLGLFLHMSQWVVNDAQSKHNGRTASEIVSVSSNEKLKKAFADVEKWEGSLNYLQKAARAGLVGAVRTLVARHPQLMESPAKDGTTAIHWAALSGKIEIVDILANEKVNLEQLDFDGNSPVILASKCGYHKLVEHFVKTYSVKIEYNVTQGDTEIKKSVFDIAIENKDEATMTALVQLGASVGITSVIKAVKTGDVTIYNRLKKFINSDNINTREPIEGETALLAACKVGKVEIASDLLDRKADWTVTDFKSNNVLHLAIESKNPEMLDLMFKLPHENLKKIINGKNVYNGSESSFLITGRDKGILGYHYIEVERGVHHTFKNIIKGGGACDISHYGKVIKSGWGKPNTDDKQEIEERYANRNISGTKKDMTALHYAIWFEETDMAQMLVEQGADVAAQDCFHMTPGHYASLTGMLDLINLLHRKGCALDELDYMARSPLKIAELNNQREVVAKFKDLHNKTLGNCKARKCDGDGKCALRKKANTNNFAITKLMDEINQKQVTSFTCADFVKRLQGVTEDAMKSKCDSSGQNLLHVAVIEGLQELVKALQYTGLLHCLYDEKVTSTASKNTYVGLTAIQIAMRLNKLEIKELLMKLRREDDSITLLQRLASQGDLKGVEILLRNHSEMLTSSHRNSALFYAVNSGNIDILKALSKKKLPQNCVSKDGETLIGRAVSVKSHEILRYLIEDCGLDCNKKSEGQTPLEKAVQLNDIESVKILLEYKVIVDPGLFPKLAKFDIQLTKSLLECETSKLNSRDPQTGKSALFMACESGNLNLMNYLLKKGADETIRDFRCRTLFHAAIDSKKIEVLDKVISIYRTKDPGMINEKDRYLGSERCFLVSGRDQGTLGYHYIDVARHKLHIFREIIRTGGSCDVAEYGNVIKSGWGKPTAEVKAFIDDRYRATEATSTKPKDMSPLHYALLRESPQMAIKLIKNGADINSRDLFGLTPAHMAAMRGCEEVLKELKMKGDSFTATSEDGVTPCRVAEINKHQNCVDFFKSEEKSKEINVLLEKMKASMRLIEEPSTAAKDQRNTLKELHKLLGDYLSESEKYTRGESVGESKLPIPVTECSK